MADHFVPAFVFHHRVLIPYQMCNNKSMSLGAKNPMGPGPHRKKLLTSPGLSQHWVVIQLQEEGLICHLSSFAEQECTLQAMRAATNSQPRKNLPPLVPEFKQVIHQDSQAPLPPHARLLSTPKQGYVASAKENNDNQVTVGIHFSPEEFLKEAVRLCHPTEHNSLFQKEVRANVAHLSNNTHQIALERTEEVKRWVALSKELSTKERDLKFSVSPRVAEVLKDKRRCLLERLLEEAGHGGTSLVEGIKKRFDLTGALPRSGVFNQKFRPASMTCEDLRKVSNLSRDVLLESVRSSGDKEVDISLFAKTLKEVEKGFIKGPINREELPAGSTLTKRFPVKQKSKVRPIDDYNASLISFAVAQSEGVTIHTIDHIASMIAFWMKSGSLSAKDGLVAKCWDLSDAYKQVPLPDEAFHLDSYLAVYDPGCSSAKIFKLLHLLWSVYFDDFLCLTRSSESKHVEFCVDSLFSLVGWRIYKNKLLDFNALCKGLRVQLDLRQSGDKLCFVTNTEERVEELVLFVNCTKPFAPRCCPGVKERNSEEDSNLPVHKSLEGSSEGC